MATKEVNICKKNMHLENLKCSSCFHTLKSPKTLSCGHTFCFSCIPGSLEGNDGVVICEVCDEHTNRQDIYCALHMTSLLEVVKKIEAADGAHCYACEREIAASFFCRDCEWFYCEECLNVHVRIHGNGNHESYSLEDFFSEDQFDSVKNQIRRCTTHDNPLNCHCLACDVSICMACTDANHKFHEVGDIDRSFDEKLLAFEDIKESSQELIHELEGVYESIDGVKADLEFSKECCLEDISEYGKTIERAVIARIQSHTNEVHKNYRQKMEVAAAQKKNILIMKDNLCETSQIMINITEFKNPALIMTTGRRIIQTLMSQNTNVTDLEPVINQHMCISDANEDLIRRIQVIPDIICMNGSFVKNCKLNPTTDGVISRGHVAKFHLLTNDIEGNAVTIGGADVRAIFKHHTGDHEVVAGVHDKNDGSYEITACCDVTGKYSVGTCVFGRPIPDIPHIIAVQWVAMNKVYAVHKGQKFPVLLHATDDFGDVVENTLEDISADLITLTDEIKNIEVDYSDGICKVRPTPLLDTKGHWKIIFRDGPNEVTRVDIHVFEWDVDVVNIFKQQHQRFEIHFAASNTPFDIKPTKKPKMSISLMDPEGKAKSVRAVKIDGNILYRLSLKCDFLGQWLINASVFDCRLQQVTINIIEWVVDAAFILTCGEHFEFRVWARDVHRNAVEEATAVVKAQATNPVGEIVDLQVDFMEEGVYIIHGNLDVVGQWSLKVNVDDEELTPMDIRVVTWNLDPDYVILSSGETFHAKLVAVDSNQETVCEARANVDAFLDSVTGRHTFDVLDNSDGSYTITGQCFEIGVWKLQVQLNDDVYIMLDLQVVNWTLDVGSVTMSVGQTFSITLTSIDENGERVANGRGDVTAYLRNPNQMYRKTEVTYLNNGSYEISGMCNISGMWVLGIRVNGEPPSDFEVPIEIVKEGHVMSVDIRNLWLDATSGNIACLARYTEDSLLVCNKTNEILMITKTGEFVTRLCLEDGDRQICCICPCYDGRIVLLDQGKREVLVLPRFGQDVSTTFSNDELRSPFSVTVDRNADHIFAVDHSKHCVLKFSFSGELIQIIGLAEHTDRQLKRPWFAVTNIDGSLLISDNGNNRVQMFDSEGIFVKTLVESGRNDGSIVLPRGLSVGQSGNLLVASDHKVQLFDEHGHFIRKILEDGIMNPHGITVVSRVPRQIACVQSESSTFELFNY